MIKMMTHSRKTVSCNSCASVQVLYAVLKEVG